ncbi:anti-sigma factor family protein [Oerskovia flava]|uniref:anti-sigma factor family protein n=1 Tax=Oerskovia flava TaxID=2986422 RepID=UPI0022405FF2|nr:zf-HC2 domain-containing protein [Oerskovia sp. JB1-3-2]
MTHLGSWTSALADGQLSPEETERALAHVAACGLCAAELESARAARRTLSTACDVPPAPDLTARLLALSAQMSPADDDPLRRPPPSREPWPDRGPQPGLDGTLLDGALTGDLTACSRRRRGRVTALVVGGTGLAVVALFTLGDSPVVTPSRHLAEPLTLLAQAGPDERAAGQTVVVELTANPLGTSGPGDPAGGNDVEQAALAWMTEQGWERPARIPDGFAVSALRLAGAQGEVLELDLVGPQGSIVLRQQEGRLDDVALGDLRKLDVDGRTVHVVTDEPWHVVWQSGDTVIDVVADTDHVVVTDLVAAFPARDYDAGVPARVVRGWSTMTGALGTP